MLKAFVLVGVFGAGVAVGVLAMRAHYRASNPGAVATVTAATPLVETPQTTGQAMPLPTVEVPSTHDSASATLPQPSAVAPASTVVNDAGTGAQPIDVGPVLNKMIAKPSEPGAVNQIGDAHRALEREARDEGWAYTMEAELQNAMVNEVSTNSFKAEHVECRATLCEVRLSGTGPQGAAIKRWNESFIGQASPLGQRLFLNFSSSISDNDRTDTLLIFRKPPAPKSN